MKKLMPLPLLAVLVAAITIPATTTSASQGETGPGKGAFHAVCSFSHRLSDDPIVFPRKPGLSHSHEFFGARKTNSRSTAKRLRAGRTSCLRTDATDRNPDRSAYWVPTLYVNDQRVQATVMSAYYKTANRDASAIMPFPQGLKMIAGSARGGPDRTDDVRVWEYRCPGDTAVAGSATVAPTCPTDVLELSIRFPDCWDGVNLDSANHNSHMAYSRTAPGATMRTCPRRHPRYVPVLELIWRFPTTGGPSTRLASGAISTTHADFMNGWKRTTQAQLTRQCLNVDTYCGGGDPPVDHG